MGGRCKGENAHHWQRPEGWEERNGRSRVRERGPHPLPPPVLSGRTQPPLPRWGLLHWGQGSSPTAALVLFPGNHRWAEKELTLWVIFQVPCNLLSVGVGSTSIHMVQIRKMRLKSKGSHMPNMTQPASGRAGTGIQGAPCSFTMWSLYKTHSYPEKQTHITQGRVKKTRSERPLKSSVRARGVLAAGEEEV